MTWLMYLTHIQMLWPERNVSTTAMLASTVGHGMSFFTGH